MSSLSSLKIVKNAFQVFYQSQGKLYCHPIKVQWVQRGRIYIVVHQQFHEIFSEDSVCVWVFICKLSKSI